VDEVDSRSMRSRAVALAVLSLLCVVIAGSYVFWAVRRDGLAKASGDSQLTIADPAEAGLLVTAGPKLLFSNLSTDHNRRVAIVRLESPEGPRGMTSLTCQRIYFAAGRGLCLGSGDGTGTAVDAMFATHGYVLGPDFKITHEVSLGGFPSRVRISPDGRYGATTVFVAGHSYADAGFSTETTIIDLATGGKIGDLERFMLLRDGHVFRGIDFNYWGVTFARDSDRFYATLGTGGRTYLVEGSVTERRMRTLRENVECPSLSPDGTRLAFKKRVGGLVRGVWRFHVLDLATLAETALPELRSIDDQIEWLDDRQVLYGDGATIWVAAADGSGQPRKFLSQASSPTVLRTTVSATAAGADGTSIGVDNTWSLPRADLSVNVVPSASEIAAGDVLSYTVTVTNHGPADATNLKVDHLLPPDVSFIGPATATNPGRGYGCALYDDQHRISCDTALLPNRGTWTMSLKVRPGPAGAVSARFVVSGDQPDPHPDNDSTVVQTKVR
jgi:uncharacterized repeat protein (TIGR01451 family)